MTITQQIVISSKTTADSMRQFNLRPLLSTLAMYNSLIDPHLQCYFSNERIRRHLRHAGLISRRGEVVPDSEYRVKLAEREHKKHVRQMLAENIVHRALDMERTRQAELRKQFEMVAKSALVSSVKESRRRPQSHNTTADMAILQMSSSWSHSRPRSANNDMEVMNEEFGEPSRISRVHSAHISNPKKSKSPRRRLQRPKTNTPLSLNRSFTGNTSRSHSPTKELPSCEVTMIYYGPHTKIDYDHNLFEPLDEVMVMQQHCGGENLPVFKKMLKAGDTFQFKSRRHPNFPFGLSLYVKGLIDSRISTCCEYKHRNGVRLGGERGHFGIQSVQGSKPCLKCRFEKTAKLKIYADSPHDESKMEIDEPVIIPNRPSEEAKPTYQPVQIPVRTPTSTGKNYDSDFSGSQSSDSDTKENQHQPERSQTEKTKISGGYSTDSSGNTSNREKGPSSKVVEKNPKHVVIRKDSSSGSRSSGKRSGRVSFSFSNIICIDRLFFILVKSSDSTEKTWQVIFHTSEFQTASLNGGQNPKIKISFINDHNNETEGYIISTNNYKNCFKAGKIDRFKVKLKDIGKPKKIRLILNEDGETTDRSSDSNETRKIKWHLAQVDVVDPKTHEYSTFYCREWFEYSEQQKKQNEKVLTLSKTEIKPQTRRTVSSASSSASVSSSTRRKSREVEQTKTTGKDGTFENGSETPIQITSDNNSLHSDEDDNATPRQPSAREQQIKRKTSSSSGESVSQLSDEQSKWQVIIYTAKGVDGDLDTEDDSRIYIQLFDSKKVKTKKLSLNKTGPFRSGTSEKFDIKLSKNFVEPKQLKIGYYNAHITAAKWNIEKIELIDAKTHKRYVFPCNDDLERNEYTHIAEKLLNVENTDDLTPRNSPVNVTKSTVKNVSEDEDDDFDNVRTTIKPAQQHPTVSFTEEKPTTRISPVQHQSLSHPSTTTNKISTSLPSSSPTASPQQENDTSEVKRKNSFSSATDDDANSRHISKQLDQENKLNSNSPRVSINSQENSERQQRPTQGQENKSIPRPKTRHGRQDDSTVESSTNVQTTNTSTPATEIWKANDDTSVPLTIEPLALDNINNDTARTDIQSTTTATSTTTNKKIMDQNDDSHKLDTNSPDSTDGFKNWYPNNNDDDLS
ncbi:unnamed protein product [Didymodactylos carnosus]|uniref:PLAT domain-containing protein n=1 Tax=Didymodactylos carnosus TaxID=1234261 RepID=A0A814K8G2_9BILA|nr:unnamed protein product [Didymodactylos carnosus]CAF1047660.1 unnamed protein product [Didymodactylos carnosus]CAF3533618.1 unnamed protein product [Didymodactylos carnosus]CAF3817381.1 unnamed protein product [Didymodactylos carnosus]